MCGCPERDRAQLDQIWPAQDEPGIKLMRLIEIFWPANFSGRAGVIFAVQGEAQNFRAEPYAGSRAAAPARAAARAARGGRDPRARRADRARGPRSRALPEGRLWASPRRPKTPRERLARAGFIAPVVLMDPACILGSEAAVHVRCSGTHKDPTDLCTGAGT